jgi:hypothetical protein
MSGTCTSNGSAGSSRLPNMCSDVVCTDLGGDLGECSNGPDVNYCNGVVRASGRGYITCDNNSDCEEDQIDINAGNCTLVEKRPCFLDPIVATGTPDADRPVLATAFCVPPPISPGVNLGSDSLTGAGNHRARCRAALLRTTPGFEPAAPRRRAPRCGQDRSRTVLPLANGPEGVPLFAP